MISFDPLLPEFRANPYPFYDMLRSAAPIFFWEPWGLWFLTRHDDCNALLRDNRLGHGNFGEGPPQQKALWDMQRHWMLVRNPPDHTRLRSLAHKAFTPRTVARLRETIQQITDRLLDRVEEQGTMELIADLAYPLPVTVICELLGVPAADQDQFHDWSNAIARSLDLTDETAVYDRAAVAAAELTGYLDGLLRERRERPQQDLISALAAAEEAGDHLSKEELFATCALLLIAGHETTINLIGNGAYALLQHPEQWGKLRAEPELVGTAVEELLRYDSPVQLTSRMVLEDMEYKGMAWPRGTSIAFLLGAANRDPAQFAEPNRLDITRSNNRHLAFGGGIHYCLGAPLARLEGEIAFTTLARRMPDLQLAADDVVYGANYTLRGLEALPIQF